MSSEDNNNSYFYIILLRHGESEGNAQKIWQGQEDFPLTDVGKQQSEALAQHWKNEDIQFNLVIASPLKRAKETAEIITNKLEIPLEFDRVWMERDNGHYAGLSTDVARERYPLPDYINPYLPIGETGESIWELYLRGGRALNSILKRPSGSYLIVSHGGILNMVLYSALGITPQTNFQGARFHFENTGFAKLKYTPQQHRWRVLTLNANPHFNLYDHS